MIDLNEIMTSDELFGSQFGGDSFAAWRALLSGFYGSGCTDPQMFTDLTQRPPDGPYRELWLAVGRRGGKSQIAALIAVVEAALRDYSDQLAAGEVATAMILAADRRQARTLLRYVRGLFDHPMLSTMIKRETADGLELTNRSAIEIHTASHRSVRGYTLSCAIFDEVAFWHSNGASPDAEILRGVRPALATLHGPLIAISSPYARRGILWDAYKRHYGGTGRILVAQAPTIKMNPTIDKEVIAEALLDDPASARAEWLAEFRTDIEAFVPIETIEACISQGVQEVLPVSGRRYKAFVDPSGGSVDAMTLSIGHVGDDGIANLDLLRSCWPPFSPESVVEEFSADLKRYGIHSVSGDRYAGEWPRERFRAKGIAYEPSVKPKSGLYNDLLPLLNGKRAKLLDNDRLVKELAGLERRTSRGGRDIIDHAPNQHDDLANAAAGVLSELTTLQKHEGGRFNLRL